MSVALMKDADGKPTGFVSITRDITERKNAEKALLESQQKFERLFKNNPDASVYVNADDRFVDANSRFVELFGYSLEEAKGKALDDLIVPENMRKEAKDMTEKSMEGYIYYETARKKKDGSVIPVSMSAAPIYINNQFAGCVVSYRDITERVQMQKKLEEYSQQLEEMVRKRTKQLQETQEQLVKNERLAAIGQVAAMVGHDLRNPLTGISGATYYLKRKLGSKIDKPLEEMLKLIEENVEYSEKIVSDLLEYSREIRLEPAKTTPKSIINQALSSVKIPVNIQVSDGTRDEPEVRMDVQKMKRVFVNIINNAFDAMPDGGTLKITSAQKNGKLQIAFSDSGSGIPKDVLEKVWTPFFTTKAKGMGLGLPICKRIIEAHDGNIVIESTVSRGTTFIVTVPLELEIKERGEKVWVSAPKFLLSTTTKA
ncbi:PAS domain S-box protein [Candidatus Bathyarchaeota archaeon]|nr:PAS domain S-box protein [Candidatus Bathyarchaeota archaeon]